MIPIAAVANRLAAIMGPTVCELEGPIPILKRSNRLINVGALRFTFRFGAVEMVEYSSVATV